MSDGGYGGKVLRQSYPMQDEPESKNHAASILSNN